VSEVGTSTDVVPGQLFPPASEAEIMKSWEGMRQPVVSICCPTYNHVNYIEAAICGLLAQETTFPFEVIVRDDASTDGTTEIVREYSRRYPNIVRAVIEEKNQFKKGIRAVYSWPSLATGEFIALCEGDDFWISPTKLQRQFELLQKHPEAVMSVALTHFCQQDGDELRYLETTSAPADELLGFEEIHSNYFHTSTYFIRSGIFKKVIKEYFFGHTLFGDTALRAIMISHGQFALLADVVSVYRETGSGIWSSLSREKQLLWKFNATKKLADMLPGIHAEHQRGQLFALATSLLRLHIKNLSILKSIRLVPFVFWYGLMKVPRNVRRSS
jgi:glycosyltransferase involved in cell wall biosynthesis